MKFLTKRTDGGSDSNVMGYWLIEWKSLFSIALLRFSEGSREAYHNHAFNSISWVLKGHIQETRLETNPLVRMLKTFWRTDFKPSFKPIITTRDNMHKVYGIAPVTWVLTFRGPWDKTWKERFNNGDEVTLTHGRKVVG